MNKINLITKSRTYNKFLKVIPEILAIQRKNGKVHYTEIDEIVQRHKTTKIIGTLMTRSGAGFKGNGYYEFFNYGAQTIAEMMYKQILRNREIAKQKKTEQPKQKKEVQQTLDFKSCSCTDEMMVQALKSKGYKIMKQTGWEEI